MARAPRKTPETPVATDVVEVPVNPTDSPTEPQGTETTTAAVPTPPANPALAKLLAASDTAPVESVLGGAAELNVNTTPDVVEATKGVEAKPVATDGRLTVNTGNVTAVVTPAPGAEVQPTNLTADNITSIGDPTVEDDITTALPPVDRKAAIMTLTTPSPEVALLSATATALPQPSGREFDWTDGKNEPTVRALVTGTMVKFGTLDAQYGDVIKAPEKLVDRLASFGSVHKLED